MKLTYDDVLIQPKFSEINSRSQVDISTDLGKGLKLTLPVISANMDTVTENEMCKAMNKAGGIGCYHRFFSSDKKIAHNSRMIVSFGASEKERTRVENHISDEKYYCLDVAHGAQEQVVKQVVWFKDKYPDAWLMVGNFASVSSVHDFMSRLTVKQHPDAFKIGIGPGSACTTRIKTGVGYPQISAIEEIKEYLKINPIKLIADGGMKTPGDIAKALAAGADAVMLGVMLAGTDESSGYRPNFLKDKIKTDGWSGVGLGAKVEYRGSASKESYADQGKDWDCAEGASFFVDYKGPVKNILEDIRGGLRSAFTYVGARNMEEFHKRAEFVTISYNAQKLGRAHGDG